jgi:hypothetical protein
MSTMRPTGLLRRPDHVRARLAVEWPYTPEFIAPPETIVQPVAWIRDQGAKPSCAGQAPIARRDALVSGPPWGSAVDAWTDARRRDGTLARADYGTWAESVFEGLIKRGTSTYHDGEDARPTSEDVRIDELEGELEAADKRIPETWEHRQIVGTRVPQVLDALARERIVVFGTGVRGPFFGLRRDEVATTNYLGGNQNGHEQGVVGYVASRGLFIGQGSWGTSFAGITLPDEFSDEEIARLFPCAYGRFLPGCFWFEPEVLVQAWDVDVLQVRS